MRKINSTMYYFPPESVDFITKKFREILETGSFLTMGKYCEEFEEKFAKYMGCKHAVSVNSGTAALEIVFRTLNIEGFDVIVPTNTFAATVFAVIKAGGRPIFADCTADLTIDPNDVKKKLTKKTKVIVTVHIGGMVSPQTCDLLDICKEKGIQLVEDAAHAAGSTLDDKKAGTFGTAGAFSFFPTKVMTTGEGGMIVTNDPKIYWEATLLRDQAKVKGKNYHEKVGYNWRMTEFQAIMGLTQLENLEKFIAKRTEIAKTYDSEFQGSSKISPLQVPRRVRHNYYKYIVFIPKASNRESLEQRLKKEYGVSLGGYVYDIPCHLQPVFKKYAKSNLPGSEELCNKHICPPIYFPMTPEDAVYVAQSIRKCLK